MKLITVPSSGSVANLVYSRNRGGQYTRNRTHPAQPAGTGRRALVKGYLKTASQAWTSVGGVVQAQWDVVARLHPVRNTLGELIYLTGQQFFIRINAQLLNIGGFVNNTPPASFAVPKMPQFVLTVTNAPLVQVSPSGTGVLSDKYLLAFGKPVGLGRRTWFTWWQAAVVSAHFTAPSDQTAAYTAQFGALTSGHRVFLKVTPVSHLGVTGVPQIVHGDVP